MYNIWVLYLAFLTSNLLDSPDSVLDCSPCLMCDKWVMFSEMGLNLSRRDCKLTLPANNDAKIWVVGENLIKLLHPKHKVMKRVLFLLKLDLSICSEV